MSKDKKKDNELRICLPGAEGWELWRAAGDGPFALESMLPVAEGGSPAGFRSAAILGLPVAATYSLPLWVASTDPQVVDSVVEMQLETQGLRQEEAEGSHLFRRTAAVEETRTLMALTLLSSKYRIDLPREIPARYEASTDLYFLPENRLVIWKELGHLVICLSRADQPVYSQVLTHHKVDEDAAREIACVLMTLQGQQVAGDCEGIEAWLEEGECTPQGTALLSGMTGLPVERADRPAPVRPSVASGLVPATVAHSRRVARRRRLTRQLAIAAGIVYAAIAAWVGADYLLQKRDVARLQEEVDRLEPLTGWIPSVKLQWTSLQNAVDVDAYPIETFLRVYTLLARQEGVRLTTYSEAKSRVTIVGEARDQAAAIRFQNDVKASPQLERFNWTLQPVRSGRGETTPFTIQGVLKDADVDV